MTTPTAMRMPASALKLQDNNGPPTWVIKPGSTRPVDLEDPRFNALWLEAAMTRDAVDRRAFILRYGLPNSQLTQRDDEVADAFAKLGEFAIACAGGGLFQGADESILRRMPPPPPKGMQLGLNDAIAMANEAILHLKLTPWVYPAPPTVTIGFRSSTPTLEGALWCQALAYLQRASAAQIDVRTCDYCGTAFEPTNRRQAFCSVSCRSLAHRDKAKARGARA